MVLKPFRLKTFCAEKGMAPHAPNAVPGQWSHFQEPALDQAQCARASRDQAPTESQECVFSLLDLFCSVKHNLSESIQNPFQQKVHHHSETQLFRDLALLAQQLFHLFQGVCWHSIL